MDDGVMNAFEIPEMQIDEQAENLLTFGDEGKVDKKPEEPWDPLAGF